jgi:3-oxoadipate enol-lactonase
VPEVKNGFCSIWYEAAGSGPPLVMVNGIGQAGRHWWEEFPRLLSERYRTVILDNRGTGKSDRPEEPWTMSDMTGDVQAVADDLGLETFHLLGCSLGSIIVRHFVKERGGGRLRSLGLLCPPNGIQPTEEDRNAALFWDRSKPILEQARKAWTIVHPEPWVAQNEDLLLRKFEENQEDPTPPRTFMIQLQAAMAAGDANDAANQYAWPVLIAHGTVDRLVPPENGRSLKEAIPRAHLEMLEGDSHSFWQHNPVRAAQVVLRFLDEAEQAVGRD